jgi:YHS domain-containing protein
MRAQTISLLLACLAALGGCEDQQAIKPAEPSASPEALPVTSPAPAPPASASAASGTHQLTRVDDVSQVCMVNDQFMGRAQIPVMVEGKTYFGCCEMCKGRLASDATARAAKDPVSGKGVDKSSAVIAKRADGQVLYFENEQNLQRYQAGAI